MSGCLPCGSGVHGVFAAFPQESGSPFDRANAVLIQSSGAGSKYVKGAAHIFGWNQIEKTQGSYDWSDVDKRVSQWSAGGKYSGLLLCPVSYGGTNQYTPSWYSGPMFGNSTPDGCGSGCIPVYWDSQFISAWKAFLQAAADHYNNNTWVSYIRAGFGIGFENYACCDAGTGSSPCAKLLAGLGYSTSVWMGYLEEMASYAASIGSKFQFSLNYTCYWCTDPSDVQSLASYAVSHKMALASAGLQKSDLTSSCGSNDWIQAFAQQSGKVALGQQTVSLSDPTGKNSSNTCGSLAPLLPFATTNGTQFLELYTNDLLGTFDPTNSSYAACQAAGYPAAVKTAAGLIN